MSYYNPTKNPFPFYPLEGEVWTNYKPLWFKNNCRSCCYDHILFPGLHFFQLKISNAITNTSEINNIDIRTVADNTVMASDIQGDIYIDTSGDKYLVIKVTYWL